MLKDQSEDIRVDNITGIFETYGIDLSWFSTSVGPVTFKYEFKPEGKKDILIYRAKKEDIFLAMKSLIKYPHIYMAKSELYGDIVIVEAPKEEPEYVYLKDCLKEVDVKSYEIPIIFGKDTEGKIVVKDLVDIQNILMTGATCTGKSVFLKSVVYTLLKTKTPEELQLLLIDQKQVDFYIYDGIQYLYHPVIIDTKTSHKVFTQVMGMIEERLKGNKRLPYLVILLNEFADFLMIYREEAEDILTRIATKGKEVGIYMILSTSCPRRSVFTEKLKEVISGRIAAALATKVDSEMVLDEEGAEDLLGNGDMIFKDVRSGEKVRVQAPWISFEEEKELVKKLKTKKCLCTNPDCRKCLQINCQDEDCKIHTKEKKNKFRKQNV